MAEHDLHPDSKEVWGVDDTTFNHDSLPELIEAHGDSLEVGQEVFVGEVLAPELEELVDVEGVLEDSQALASQRYGESAEGWLDAVSADARAELAQILAHWIEKHAPPDFYAVRHSRGHVLTEEDFALPVEEPPPLTH
ncbi:MAG: hypothetical protein RB191_02245 [Terriglobia bacterium]|nr:hypothetical protein [Terriglobia bacterium]